MQTTITNIIRTSPPYMVRLTKRFPHRLLPRRNCKDASRRNNVILRRLALIKEARNPACGPADRRAERRTGLVVVPTMNLVREHCCRLACAFCSRPAAFRSGSIFHDLRRAPLHARRYGACLDARTLDDVLRSRSCANRRPARRGLMYRSMKRITSWPTMTMPEPRVHLRW
jgi:hypothetical protein